METEGMNEMELHNSAEKLAALDKQIRNCERVKIQAQTKLEGLLEQHKETNQELVALGVDPKKTQESLKALELEIQAELAELEALIPTETLESYNPSRP